VAFLAWLSAATPEQARSQLLQHVGTIVNADTRAPIEADAYAYPSRSQPLGAPDCPIFDKQLHLQRSLPASGTFAFLIESQIPTYVAVYCQNGYAYRIEDLNENRTNRSPVQPAPVAMLPLRQAGLRGVDSSVMRRAIDRLLDLASRDLKYFSGADKDSFTTALKDLPTDDRTVIDALLKRSGVSGGRGGGVH